MSKKVYGLHNWSLWFLFCLNQWFQEPNLDYCWKSIYGTWQIRILEWECPLEFQYISNLVHLRVRRRSCRLSHYRQLLGFRKNNQSIWRRTIGLQCLIIRKCKYGLCQWWKQVILCKEWRCICQEIVLEELGNKILNCLQWN